MVMILVLVGAIVLLAWVLTRVSARGRPSRLRGWTLLMGLVSVGIYGFPPPFRVLAPAIAFLWLGIGMLPPVVVPARWGPIGVHAGVASMLLLSALVVATIPLDSPPAPITADQGDATSGPAAASHSSLTPAEIRATPAYTTLIQDYMTYHAVLVVAGGIAVLLFIAFSVACWRRGRRLNAEQRPWRGERTIYRAFGLISLGSALVLVVLVAANLSNVVDPHAGFAHALPDLGMPHTGIPTVALDHAVTTWVQSGSSTMPQQVHTAVQKRLAWQRPKAIVCSLVLAMFVVVTAGIWHTLIHRIRARAAWLVWHDTARLSLGVLAVPGTLVLIIMAIANTQASFAPITLTLLFG